MISRRFFLTAVPVSLFTACGRRRVQTQVSRDTIPLYPNETPELRALINKYAQVHDIPVTLLHRVIIRESTHRPWARNGPYYGFCLLYTSPSPRD